MLPAQDVAYCPLNSLHSARYATPPLHDDAQRVPDVTYLPRIVDAELSTRLRSTGGVVVEGPKACGKTATARQVAVSEVLLDVDPTAREAIAVDPRLALEGSVPRLIDEWQLEPAIWDHVRREIDDRAQPGQFILTGSSIPADDVTRHSGAGRIARLQMRPMTLFETGHSTAQISLAELLAGTPARSRNPGIAVADLADRIAVGGWPGQIGRSVPDALRAVRDYLEEIRRTDINRLDGVRRDPEKVGRLLRSLARNTATYASDSSLAADAGGASGPLKQETVAAYLDALARLRVIEDQPAWSPDLRSRSILRSAAKRHFIDPSLAVAAMRTEPTRLLRDVRLLGFLFESLVIRDLRVYAQHDDARVLQYRDNTGLEVDAVIEHSDGRWAGFEVKLGVGQIDEAAANLIKFATRVDTGIIGRPMVLGVIVGFGFGYVRPDGVAVVPIGALGP